MVVGLEIKRLICKKRRYKNINVEVRDKEKNLERIIKVINFMEEIMERSSGLK